MSNNYFLSSLWLFTVIHDINFAIIISTLSNFFLFPPQLDYFFYTAHFNITLITMDNSYCYMATHIIPLV